MGSLVAVLADYWCPGWRAGGPIVSLTRLVERTELDTAIVTRDHDLGSPDPYPGITPDTWVENADATSRIAYTHGWGGVWWALRELRGEKPSVLHINSVHSPAFAVLPLLLARMGFINSRVLLLTPHGELASSAQAHKRWKKSVARPFLRWLVRDRVVWHASSSREVQEIAHWLRHEPTAIISPDPAPSPAREASLGPTTPTVLFASRIHPIKGLDIAIEIMRSIHTPCRFVIAGQPEDVGYWNDCRSRLSELPDHVSVDIRGPYAPDEASELMDQATVLLLPTKGENFGQVIAEALSRGCPVAIPPTTPWPEYVGESLGCIADSSDDLSHYVELLLSESLEDRRQRRTAVVSAYRSWFDSSQKNDLYQEVLQLAGASE